MLKISKGDSSQRGYYLPIMFLQLDAQLTNVVHYEQSIVDDRKNRKSDSKTKPFRCWR